MIKIKKYQIEDYISDATQNALDLKADLVDGKVPSSQLPSYVDDVIEVANYAALPIPGETGVIYITLDTNKVYRWTGSVYVEIASGSTNLSYTPGVSNGTVNSDTGSDAVIPLAGLVNAGLFSAAEKSKLDGLELQNLQEVVNIGNSISNYGGIGNASIQSTNFSSNRTLYLNNNSHPTIKLEDNLDGNHYTVIDIDTLNLSGVSYSWSSIIGGSQNLQDVTDEGSTTTNSIQLIDSAEVLFGTGGGILLDNASRLREGTIDSGLGGSKGIAQICSIGYELKWEAGRLYVMNGNGNGIRESLYNFNIVPTVDDDDTKAYYIGSLWSLDNGDVYECLDATTGSAVWDLKNIGSTPNLQQVTDEGATTTNPITANSFVKSGGTSSQFLKADGSADSTSYTTAQNLQQVTDIGATTTNSITANSFVKSGGTSIQYLMADGSITNVVSAVTSVSATSPITSSGGTTPIISTSMETNKLIGRSTSGTGVMEQITIGSGLTLSAGTLTNTATPTPIGYYGAFQDMLTQTLTTANVGQPFLIRTVDESNQVSITTNGSGQLTRITPANTGTYNIQWSGQFQNSDNAIHDINVWFRKGLTSSSGPGTDIVGSNGIVALPARKSASAGEQGHVVAGWNFLLTISAGEYVEFYWMSTSTQVSLQAYAAGSPPPSTASLIVTVTQQSGIMAGTGITGLGTSGNAQTGAVQILNTNGSGTDFNIVSSGNTHTFNLPTASASNRGALSSANWTTFNNKLTPNTAITGATNTKITYGANGLVTAGTTLIASDIPNIAKSQVTSLTTDLGLKAPLASPTFTGTVVLPSTTSIGNVSDTEIGYLDGVLSNIQIQLDQKTTSPIWVDYSSASTVVGWASFTTKNIKYIIIGKSVTVYFFISGISNTANATFTVPTALNNVGGGQASVFTVGLNNNATALMQITINNNSNVIGTSSYFVAFNATNPLNSSAQTKQIKGTITYEIA